MQFEETLPFLFLHSLGVLVLLYIKVHDMGVIFQTVDVEIYCFVWRLQASLALGS